jgi:hypothetical protein
MTSERRLNDRLTTYWNHLRQDDALPTFSKFNTGAIDDVWDNCILFMVNKSHNDNKSYTFYRMGDRVKKLYNEDLVGNTLKPAQKMFKGAAIIKRIDDAVKNGTPIEDHGQFVSQDNKVVKFRSCLLPFGNDNEVTHVVAGLSWREF